MPIEVPVRPSDLRVVKIPRDVVGQDLRIEVCIFGFPRCVQQLLDGAIPIKPLHPVIIIDIGVRETRSHESWPLLVDIGIDLGRRVLPGAA